MVSAVTSVYFLHNLLFDGPKHFFCLCAFERGCEKRQFKIFSAPNFLQQLFSGHLSSTQVLSVQVSFHEYCFSRLISHWHLCLSVFSFKINHLRNNVTFFVKSKVFVHFFLASCRSIFDVSQVVRSSASPLCIKCSQKL